MGTKVKPNKRNRFFNREERHQVKQALKNLDVETAEEKQSFWDRLRKKKKGK